MTEKIEPTAEAESKKERHEAWINAGIALAGILVIIFILVMVDLTPLPAQRPFTRISGETRIETAIEASRMWPISGNQAFVTASAGGTQAAYWSKAKCAVAHESGPLPLILRKSNEPRASVIARAEDYLGGRPVSDTSCAAHTVDAGAEKDQCLESPWNVLKVPGAAYPVEFGNWVPECPQLYSTVIFAAVKSSDDAPDLAIALPLARKLSTLERRVTIVVTPPYLEANPPLHRFLSSSEQTVERGIILGGAARIPDATQVQLVDLLRRQEDVIWLQRIATALGPFGSLLIALLTLLSGWKVAQASTPIAEAIGTRLETRVRPIFERSKDRGADSTHGPEGASNDKESNRAGESASATAPSSESRPANARWIPASLNGQRVRLQLRSGDSIDGLLDVEPVEWASIRFLRVTDVRLERTRMDYSEERSNILLVPWDEVLMMWQVGNVSGSEDSSTPVGGEKDLL